MVKRFEDDPEWSFSDSEQRMQWPYNAWFRSFIGVRIRYSFVRTYWERDMAELVTLEKLSIEEQDPVPARLSGEDRQAFACILRADYPRLMTWLDAVGDQAAAQLFCQQAGLTPQQLKGVLQKIYRYLPTGAQMRQLVEKEDALRQGYVDVLVKYRLGNSLALLEAGRTRPGRQQLAAQTGIAEPDILDLVRRADLTRLHLMGGGMVRTSWALGFTGLAALKRANAQDYYDACLAYYNRTAKGKPFDMTMQNCVSHIARMKTALEIVEE
jgi:hypothetical protein